MNFSIYGLYFYPYIIKALENDGHSVLLNKFSPDIDICLVESRFFMYNIYRNLKRIKKNKIRLINHILDIPPWILNYQSNINSIKNYIRQILFNSINKNQFFFNCMNLFQLSDKKNKYIKIINSFTQYWLNSFKKNRIYFLINYRNFLKHSDLILSLSKFTQKSVEKFLKLDTDVCYPCVNSEYLSNLPKVKLKYDAINISRIVPYKHQDLFVKAAKRLNLNIIVLGRYSNKSIKLECPHYYYKDHYKVMDILNETLFYVDASEFEGFGMTPIEALFLDKPVIASNIYVHREILGDSVIYFEPNNLNDLIEKMKIVLDGRYQLNNSKIKEKYSALALKQRLMGYIESLF